MKHSPGVYCFVFLFHVGLKGEHGIPGGPGVQGRKGERGPNGFPGTDGAYRSPGLAPFRQKIVVLNYRCS